MMMLRFCVLAALLSLARAQDEVAIETIQVATTDEYTKEVIPDILDGEIEACTLPKA
jgi:hypothetical protein